MSPELALVDAALATRLRAILDAQARHVAESPSARSDGNEPADDPVEYSAVVSMVRVDGNDPIADLIVQGQGSGLPGLATVVTHEHDPGADLFVQETDRHAETSHYPALPSPAGGGSEQLDATEMALREIRNRLTTPTSARRRRLFRRRFTVASGVTAAIALGLLATNVGFGATQLHV